MKNPFERLKKKFNKDSLGEGSFVGRIGSFFSPEPQKEKVLRHEDFNAAGDVYYADISVAYKIVGRILWIFLVFFLVFSITLNYREITYDNFYYLFKDFSSAVDVKSSTNEILSYDADSRQKFSLYKGGLVTVSPSAVSVYTPTGRRTVRDNIVFSSPYLECSDKYALIYDASGNSFSVYNSFAKIYTETLDYPITDACFAEDGRFAILTRDADSRAVVLIYSKNFKRLAKYSYDSYIFDVAMDSDNKRIAMLFYDQGDGIGRTGLLEKNIDDLSEIRTTYFRGEFPLAVTPIGNDRLAVVTDYAVRIFDSDGEELSRAEYFDGEVTDIYVSPGGVAVSTLRSAENRVAAVNPEGELIYNGAVPYNISEIGIDGNFIFINTGSGVARMAADGNGKAEYISSGGGKMLIYDSETVMVCGESKAEYLVYSDYK